MAPTIKAAMPVIKVSHQGRCLVFTCDAVAIFLFLLLIG
jgi:hypothetical protein